MAEGGITLETQYVNFSKFGDTQSDGTTITLTQLDKWLKQAQILGKTVTNTDTGVCFNKFKTRKIDYLTFGRFLEELSTRKKIPVAELKDKLIECGLPGTAKTQPTNMATPENKDDPKEFVGTTH